MYLLDTNVLIHAQRGQPLQVRSRLRDVSPDDVSISAVTIAELWYGAARSPDPDRKRGAWRRFLQPIAVLPFDTHAAELHGELRFRMRHSPIGERDLVIAATALSKGLTVVSANVSELSRVPGLTVEDWTVLL